MESKQPGGGSSSAPAPTRLERRGAKRPVVLFALLILVATGALVFRWPSIHEWWLGRQPLETLRVSASAETANPGLLLLYGRRQLDAGDAEGAMSTLDRAASRLAPDDKSATAQKICSLSGYLHARRGDAPQAVPLLTRARTIDSDDPTPYLGFGILLASQKLPRFAVTQFQVVTQLDPNNVEAWFRMGRAYNEDYKAHEAIAPLKKAISLAPNDAASHAELGTSYATRSEFASAVAEFRRAVELKPENDYYKAALANSLALNARSQKDYAEAAQHLSAAMKSLPNLSSLQFTLGLLHLRFNDVADARDAFAKCVVQRPNDPEAWYNLSIAEMRLGNGAASEAARKRHTQISDARTEISNLEKKVQAEPRSAPARMALSKSYLRLGNHLGAYWQATTAAKLAPTDTAVSRFAADLRQRYPEVATAEAGMQGIGSDQAPGPPPPPEIAGMLTGQSVAPPSTP